jgi:hypothetical protein
MQESSTNAILHARECGQIINPIVWCIADSPVFAPINRFELGILPQ